LPDLEVVRAEASRFPDVIRNPRDPNCAVLLGLDFPNLVKYAIHSDPDKVPKDILHECIWAGERFIWGAEASSVEQLRCAGVLPSDATQLHRIRLVRRTNVFPSPDLSLYN
ncbi:hypothetical protein EV121DRAFT_259820, partial [Schizophyllum commune]